MASLDKKYRPKSFKTFYGNAEVITSIRAHLKKRDTFPSSILLKGPSGCGKTTMARIITSRLNISYAEVFEINVADARKIDDARDIIENLRYAPLQGNGKVVILNECHEAVKHFQDALLEVMEEPPKNVYFILCTTDPQKLLPAIKTRVTPYLITTLDSETITKLITRVCKKEDIDLSTRMIKRVAHAAEGVPRSALVLLNDLQGHEDSDSQKRIIENFQLEDSPQINALCQLLLKGSSYKEVMKVSKEIQEDAERVRRAIMNYMSKVLQGKPHKRAAMIMDNCWDSWYWVGRAGLTLTIYHIMEGDKE
jgi:DNA polymerase-3 subunit gamma/tau